MRDHRPYTARLLDGTTQEVALWCAACGLPWPCDAGLLLEKAMALATLLSEALDSWADSHYDAPDWRSAATMQLADLKEITSHG